MKILISGDFCPIGRADLYLKEEKYAQLFNGFETVVNSVDFAVVNMECPITPSEKKIVKTGPCIKSENLKSFNALKFAGFDLLTMANNHIQDYGSQGVNDTITTAREYGFETIGAGNVIESAKKPFITEIKGIKIGFINISENEFCTATGNSAGAYTFDLIDNLNVVKKLKQKVDQIILIYHGGREHYQLPTPEQRKRFRFFIDSGVDAIVSHHTHCFSGFEYYHGKPIVYSLGNFIFDYKKKYQHGKWTEGMSVILNLIDGDFKVELLPHTQGTEDDCTLHLLEGDAKDEFLERVNHLNEIITDDVLFMSEWNQYIKSQEKFYLSSVYIKNIYVRMLFAKGLLPISFLRSKHNKLILNLFRCETHKEISQSILENNIR
ncbi:CapA family protein [Kaistella carnis]|uniref:CapA family protein n=1 Tax=Kaistella carnis TaxID=1241979 RepID=UPI0028A5A22F|nr:CapA family protein [Kaistella carnis]